MYVCKAVQDVKLCYITADIYFCTSDITILLVGIYFLCIVCHLIIIRYCESMTVFFVLVCRFE